MGRSRKKGDAITGWLVLDKPLGMTSTQALGKVRYLLNAKKAGHAGTLDPLASGVLPLAFGEATKTIPFMMDARKSYDFSVHWGAMTNTLDAEGEVIARSDARPDRAAIEAILPSFLGDIMQMPPIFSALKVDGKRAYDLARAGEEVKLKARPVRVDGLELVDIPDADHASFRLDCGKGTYVRSLARDIAQALGTQGYVSTLRRTRVGAFAQDKAISLEAVEGLVHAGTALEKLEPLSAALSGIATLSVSAAQAQDLRHGRAILVLPMQHAGLGKADPASPVYAHHDGEAIALGTMDGTQLKPMRVFNAG